jgi:argininosuccinate lyase
MRNSLDAVADRDFALDYLYASTVLFVHLSRIGEELVLWTTSEFGFARLPEQAATGSSIMPQKLNPDVAELARGKAGTAIGRLTGLLATVKSLALAYDRDLQEDKASVFEAVDDVMAALEAAELLVSHLEFDADRLASAASDPALLATDVAEQQVLAGVPFRKAHDTVGRAVRDGNLEAPWSVKRSLRKRDLPGAPHPGRVSARAKAVRREAAALGRWAKTHPPSLPI